MVNNKKLEKCTVDCGDHKSLLVIAVLSQINPVLILQFYIVKMDLKEIEWCGMD
jgi:tRNA-binding EMAP/Myf-like protein